MSVEVQHDGFVSRWGPRPGAALACVAVWFLWLVYTAAVVWGVRHGPWDARLFFLALFLLSWPVPIGLAISVTDRFELRVTPGDLVLVRRRWGRTRRERVELAGASVRRDVTELPRGGWLLALVVTDAAGRALRIDLPGSDTPKDRPHRVADLEWHESQLRALIARALPPEDDAGGRAAVAALVAERSRASAARMDPAGPGA